MAISKRKKANGKISYGVQVYRGNGVHDWIGTRDTWAEAKQLEREESGKRTTGQETCASFALRWPDDYAMRNGQRRWAPSTDYSNRIAVRRFIKEFGDLKLARLPEERRFIPWANSLPPSVVKVLRAMLADAKRSRLISENPLSELAAAQSKGRSKIEAITEPELDLLGRCAYDAWSPHNYGSVARALIIWQGSVGTRPIAIRHLLREHVDLGKGEVYLEWPGKNVAPRTVLIPPVAIEVASEMPRRIDAAHFFSTRTGKAYAKHTFYDVWQPIRTLFETKLPPERARQLRDARKDAGPMELYELRHCAATSLRRRGASWEEIAWQLAQTDKGVQAQKVYSHLTETDHMAGLRRLFGQNVADLSEAREASNG